MNALWVPAQWWNTTFYKLWAMVLHGPRAWSMQMIDAGDWCRWFIKTIQVQMIPQVDRINVLWVPAQWSNTTFHKLFAMVLHGSCTWPRQMIDADVWCRLFIKTVQVQMIRKVDHINVLWVPAQESNTTFYKLFALVLHGSLTWSRHMIDRVFDVDAHGRGRWVMRVFDVDDSLRRFRYRWSTKSTA